MDHYRVPIVFFLPDNSLKGVNNSIANQIDVLPTVMHLINYPYSYFSLGNDLFDSTKNKCSINYNAGVYQYIDSSYCYQFNGREPVALYNWKRDSLLTKNILTDEGSLHRVQKCDTALKKIIQLYNHSMINNHMYVNSKL